MLSQNRPARSGSDFIRSPTVVQHASKLVITGYRAVGWLPVACGTLIESEIVIHVNSVFNRVNNVKKKGNNRTERPRFRGIQTIVCVRRQIAIGQLVRVKFVFWDEDALGNIGFMGLSGRARVERDEKRTFVRRNVGRNTNFIIFVYFHS